MELLMEILYNGIFYGGRWIIWYMLLKENFKYNKYVVFVAFFTYATMEQVLMHNDMHTTVFMALSFLYQYTFQSFLYKGNIINSYNLDFFVIIISNILPNLSIVVFAISAAFLSGNSAKWFNSGDMTTGMELIMELSVIIGYIITYIVCRQLKTTVLNLQWFWKYFIFFFGTILGMINCVLRTMVEPDYATSPYGILFYIDMFTMCLCVIATVVILTRNLLEKREINRRITRRMEEEYRKYQRSFALQQELRELNHEVKNQLIAKNGQVLR